MTSRMTKNSIAQASGYKTGNLAPYTTSNKPSAQNGPQKKIRTEAELKAKRCAMVIAARADVERYWRSHPGTPTNKKLHRAIDVLLLSKEDWAPPQHA